MAPSTKPEVPWWLILTPQMNCSCGFCFAQPRATPTSKEQARIPHPREASKNKSDTNTLSHEDVKNAVVISPAPYEMAVIGCMERGVRVPYNSCGKARGISWFVVTGARPLSVVDQTSVQQ